MMEHLCEGFSEMLGEAGIEVELTISRGSEEQNRAKVCPKNWCKCTQERSYLALMYG